MKILHAKWTPISRVKVSNGFNIWNWINKFFIKEFAFPTNRIETNKMNYKTEIRTLYGLHLLCL